MSVKSFKFVSPGIFVNEVDNSQLPRLPEDMGPVIIGRAERGPGMVPVKIESFSEFVETFGEPVTGANADDLFRQGNRIGPTYGAFAAQAYLRNGSPVTFVRLLGEHHPDAATDAAKAGWSMGNAFALTCSKGGTDVVGAILYTSKSGDNSAISAAMQGDNIKLTIKEQFDAEPAKAASGTLTLLASIIKDNLQDNNVQLTLKLSDFATETTTTTITFDKVATTTTNPADNANVMNIGVGNITSPADLAQLIASGVNDHLKVSASVSVNDAGRQVITFIKDTAEVTVDFLAGSNLGSIGAITSTEGTNEGTPVEETNSFIVNFDKNSKLYIRDVLNTNPTLTNERISSAPEKYFLGPTFEQALAAADCLAPTSVSVAHYADGKDHRASAVAPKSPWVYSQFIGSVADLTTNLAKTNLSKLFRFHSLYAGEWEQKNFKISIVDVKGPSNQFKKYGTFTVLVRDAKDNDAAPVVYERFSNVNLDPTSPRYIAQAIGDQSMVWRESERRYVHEGEFLNQSRYIRVEMATDVATGSANAEFLPFAFEVPKHALANAATFRLRDKTSGDTKLSTAKDACFGITTSQPNNVGRFDNSYQDLVRPFFGTEDMFPGSGRVLFSLDLIEKDGAEAKFTTGSMNSRVSINGAIGANYSSVLDEGFDKFTLPLCGGLDGLDITEIEPFCDDVLSGKSSLTSAAYNSISKAIDIVSDPEVVECNLMAIPGVSNSGLTEKLISLCETRGDALAVIDLENDYKPRGWDTSAESARLPSVDLAVSSLKSRALSSSYGCAFFPWVQVKNELDERLVWMPPSVVALGTMASSAAKSELWFAPAGFTRGGLSSGAGGLPVVQTRLRLTSKDRDKLYEANINPIAQFPAEGIVIFGQKTLQVTPSALDRINVRRLMVHVKKEVSRMAATTLFDQNLRSTWNRFLSQAEPFLASVKSRFGLSDYKIVLDETTTTPELVDRNIVYAKIFLKPARAIEFIAIDFVITNTGASFED